ncbi:MAG: ankyrin repeat domain-containing protein [Janthinobacterium lividum]
MHTIHAGDGAELLRLLVEHPELAAVRLGDDDPDGMSRTLLHVATDWPGHFPNGPGSVATLVEAGADVNARFRGPHEETPLHWAASSDDVRVLDALLDHGADIEAPGAVTAAGTPLDDATAFGQWAAARRLVARGARVNRFAAASLGLMSRLRDCLQAEAAPEQLGEMFWAACHGGQLEATQYVFEQGAALDWLPGWEDLTPLDAAARSGAHDVVAWLHSHGARTAAELRAA